MNLQCPICKQDFQYISHLREHDSNQLTTALWFELRDKQTEQHAV